jgi:16S rRNA (guanine966-N2)-methyltransferase
MRVVSTVFSGSGALGFEAVSRYAAHATLLEADRMVAAQLKKNVALINTDKVTVQNTDALKWLSQLGTPYQVVFLDPPFRKGLLAETITLLENNGWLAEDASIYVEAEVESAAADVPANWTLHREKVAGQVAYRLYLRSAP